MKDDAKSLGADAVINVRITTSIDQSYPKS